MKYLLTAWMFGAFVLSVLISPPSQGWNAARTIEITVRSNTNDGKPLSNMPFIVVTTDKRTICKTAGSGVAVVHVQVAENEHSIDVLVLATPSEPGTVDSHWTLEEQRAISIEMLNRFKQYHIQRRHQIVLQRDRDRYIVEIIAELSAKASGVVVHKDDSPFEGIIVGDSFIQPALASGRRVFQVTGIQRSKAVTLFALKAPMVTPIRLSAEQTQTDVDLGKIVVSEYDGGDAPIAPVCVNGMELVNRRVFRYMSGLTLISLDGTMIFTFQLAVSPDAPDRQVIRSKPGEFWTVPAREYYVLPGYFSPTDEQYAIVNGLLAAQDLSNFALARVSLKSKEVNAFEFDMLDAHQKVQAMMHQPAATQPKSK